MYTNNEQEGVSQFFSENEPEELLRNIRITLIRHAEPQVYGSTNSPLTDNGIKRAIFFGKKYIQRIIETRKNGADIHIYYSSRERTLDTAGWIAEVIDENEVLLAKHNIALVEFEPSQELLPDKTLGPLEENGTLREQLYERWKTAPEADLEDMGAVPPSAVYQDVFGLLFHARHLAQQPGMDLEMLWVTHETTHAAIINACGLAIFDRDNRMTKVPERIKYLEPIVFQIGNQFGSGLVHGDFREREFIIPLVT